MRERLIDIVRRYHQRTKHHPQAYARGPDALDWADQPDPFRRFDGCQSVRLPLTGAAQPAGCETLHGVAGPSPCSPSLDSIGALLQLSFGLSAWKACGQERWALRCNPSSGNLHPTEAYVVVLNASAVEPGVYHYVSHDHALERRCRFKRADPTCDSLLVGLSSIHWREGWKYGERAYRYCQHDIGHALAALRYAAAVLGWRLRLLAEWSDHDIAALLGLDRHDDFVEAERESPDLLCSLLIGKNAGQSVRSDALLAMADAGEWSGRANRLSPCHRHDWPVIDAVSEAAMKPRTDEPAWSAPARPPLESSQNRASAAAIIMQRRSAQRFDGRTAISLPAYFGLLDALLPRRDVPPLDVWRWRPRIHCLLFVHRVTGLTPGLYLLARDATAVPALQAAMRDDFTWTSVHDCPDHIPLYRLLEGDCRGVARSISCHQDIAADSIFSLGMIAEFGSALEAGPWVYRRLFWEAGVTGQILYLEAEACGLRGTGIGCYFDDPVHDLLGLDGDRYQSLYHFTVGRALEDPRLQTLPAYAHLSR